MRRLLTIALGTAAVLAACTEDKASYVPNVGDGETTPTMLTTDVRTFVSDSGYTRYYITSPVWAMHDEAAEPFWRFPDTLQLEQFDRDMAVTSRMRCDSAIYLTRKRLWKLFGHVRMVNVNGDSFATPYVEWDQAMREVRSDSFVHIVRSDRIIEGRGFVSNEPMTEYTIKRPTGIFPISREMAEPAPADSAARDSIESRPAQRRRPSRS